MRKADFKKLLAALDAWTEDVAGKHTGYNLGDKVTWKGEDEDLPRGTLGTVHLLHDDGDVEAVFMVRGEEQVFTFAAHRLNLVSSSSAGSNGSGGGGGDASSTTTNTSRLLSSRRGSMEPGTLDGNTRTGVSFGLKGPCGGRLVSITLESQKALGMVLGEVGNDLAAASSSKKKEKPRVLVVDVVANSEAAKMSILVGDRIHTVSVGRMESGRKRVAKRHNARIGCLHLDLQPSVSIMRFGRSLRRCLLVHSLFGSYDSHRHHLNWRPRFLFPVPFQLIVFSLVYVCAPPNCRSTMPSWPSLLA